MKTIIKKTKQVIISSILISSVIIASNSFAANYIDDAKQYMEKGEYKAAIIQLKNQLKAKPQDAQARFLLGKSYLKTGALKQADKEISRAYQLNKNNDDAALTYAQILITKRKFKEINKVLNKEFNNPEKEYQRQIYRAYAFLGQNQLADAKQIFSELANQSENVQVFNGLAKIAISEKEMDVAEQWLEKSLKLEPENIVALQIKVRITITKKNYVEALTIYNNMIQMYSNNLALYLQRAALKIQQKDLKDAEKDIRIVLEQIKNQPQANYMLAQIKLEERNYREAQEAAQNVINLFPQHFNSMLILGAAHFGQGNYNQAEKYLIQYLSENPNNLDVQNLLARIYLDQKKVEQALLILENIDVEKRDKNVKVLTTLGGAYLLNGEHQKCIDVLNKANEMEPNNTVVQKKLIAGQFKTGDIDSAISGLEKIINLGHSNQRINYLLIVSYIQKKELEKAEGKIEEFIQKNPEDPSLYNLTAIIEKLKGNNKKASKAFKKAIQIDDKYIPPYLGLAELSILKKDWVTAKAYYSKVVQINPKYLKAYIYLAAIAEKQNLDEEFEQLLKAGLDQAKDDSKSQIMMASVLNKWYIKQKTPEKILPVAQELYRNYPNNYEVLSFRAKVLILNKKNAQAEKILRAIINNNQSDVEHRLLLVGLLAKNKENKNDVLEILDLVIKITPENPQPLMLKAVYLLNDKQYQEAIDVANYAKKQFPTLALGYQLKGNVYRLEKKLDQALINYQAAYKVQPNNKLLYIISDLLNSQGKEREALQLLEGELKNNDKDFSIHFKIANIYQNNKQYDLAVKHYSKMLEIKTDNVVALNNLAWTYAKENDPKALIFAKKAYEIAPKSSSIMDTYGYIQIKQGNLGEGVKVLEKAVKLAPKSYDIKYHLAEGYYSEGKNEKARELLSALLNKNISFSEKESAKVLFEKLK